MSIRSNGSYIGFTRTPTTSQNSASGIWSLAAAERQRRASAWPVVLPPFSPTDITGLSVWFDASDASTLYDATSGGSLVAADGTVKRWEDKSGNARHATEGTNAPQRKAAQVNSLDALLFNGSNSKLAFSGSIESGSGYFSAFVVARRGGTSGVGFLLNKDNSGVSPRAHQFLRVNDATVESIWFNSGSAQSPTKSSISANTTFLASARLGASGGAVAINGVYGSANTNTSSISTTNEPTQIGNFSLNNDGPWNGEICEIVAYNSAISDTDKDAVEAYLMTKWGIT
jgi:hypothetical protein